MEVCLKRHSANEQNASHQKFINMQDFLSLSFCVCLSKNFDCIVQSARKKLMIADVEVFVKRMD